MSPKTELAALEFDPERGPDSEGPSVSDDVDARDERGVKGVPALGPVVVAGGGRNTWAGTAQGFEERTGVDPGGGP